MSDIIHIFLSRTGKVLWEQSLILASQKIYEESKLSDDWDFDSRKPIDQDIDSLSLITETLSENAFLKKQNIGCAKILSKIYTFGDLQKYMLMQSA